MTSFRRYRVLFFITLVVVLFACRRDKDDDEENPPVVNIDPAYYAGGSTTVFDASSNAFMHPLANLSGNSINDFYNGEELFQAEFQTLGSGEPGGIGPLFIQTSCVSCHVLNGRGHIPLFENDLTSGLLLRLSIPGAGVHGEPLPVPGFGGQLQSRSIDGTTHEGNMSISWEDVPVTYPDGQTIILKQPYFSVVNPYTPLPDFYLRGGRLAPPIYGSGLLEAISDETLLLIADEMDVNGDGISGKPNWVWNIQTQTMSMGKFGWKSSNPNSKQQSAEAFSQDMGVTSENLFPIENCYGQLNCEGGMGKLTDLTEEQINSVAYYVLTVAPPAPRNLEDSQVQLGKTLFDQVMCSSCHIPEITTGSYAIPELSYQTIRPYTDLLLHDLGATLGDGRPDYVAGANEWRTPPLWGIGLAKLVNPNASFLHDGRAATLEEAILWHEGEAYESKIAFMNLSAAERAALIAFLNAL
ncbi:MAG: di-heme oxidoredictase family protein [Flavobacteriales bacterium]